MSSLSRPCSSNQVVHVRSSRRADSAWHHSNCLSVNCASSSLLWVLKVGGSNYGDGGNVRVLRGLGNEERESGR